VKEKLLQLEELSRALEPSSADRQQTRSAVVEYSEKFLDEIEYLKTYRISEARGRGIFDSPISESGIDISEAIELLRQNVDEPGLNPASGGHLAYIPGGGIYYSALGD
jgi:aromatic-L-amino-acid/L-tryptophan decarboxylase